MVVLPACTFENCPRLDILVVPGGWGTRKELHNKVMLDWLRARAAEVEILTAVCTGSMLLGSAGLLGRSSCNDPLAVIGLDARTRFPPLLLKYQQHVVEDGRVLTSAGIAAGTDMALKVVGRCCGEDVAAGDSQTHGIPVSR